ncbi:hypothetical protein SAMN02745126_03981 [Enhydrobacter aerosaccus]|uniref:Uncharacterized protein n=1 Tax=Enhydrobacter aerosaccus TaxID=225324 RepID=A0A1T4RNF1_9HYPH|nr:hypothetical protein [Enhydrobacter aerosaccus]SKA17514.1 hypothetical protein SAMN02745126_03981 [Enhydrobacter aerosaccus]
MPITSRLDRDLLHSLPTIKAARATINILDRIQFLSPEEQIAGACAAFMLICEGYKFPAQDAFAATKNMMAHHDDRGRSEFDAARSYLDADVFRTKPNT